MKKFLTIANIEWQRVLTYRFTIAMYRVGELAEGLVLISMWIAVYASAASGSGAVIRGFTLNEMITYLLIGNVFAAVVRNYVAGAIARDVFDGTLSLFLVRPMPYFKFMTYSKAGNMLFIALVSITSQFLLVALFFNKFIVNIELKYVAVIVAMLILAFITEFLLNFIVGLTAFWTDEVEGLFATIDRVRKFFSGGYFPLSILPVTIATIASFLPFAYTFYVPAQLYLKKISLHAGLVGLAVQVGWIIILALVLRLVWVKGMKRFEGVGL